MGSDDETRKDSDGPLPVFKAAVPGLAALLAAALAVGAADGAPPGSAPGQAVRGAGAAPVVVDGGRGGPAALSPISRLCFRGPRGEPVDFPAVHHCP